MKKFLFYFLNFTWGLPMNIIGGLVAATLLLANGHPTRHKNDVHFELGKNWGGVSLGIFFLTQTGSSEHLRDHEYGHSIQNAIYGPFMIVLVAIPSFIRYWYRELFFYRRGKEPKTSYESIWFERQATNFGRRW